MYFIAAILFDDYKSRFWESVEQAAKEVATWPKWKKAGVLVQKETKEKKKRKTEAASKRSD